MMRPLLAPLLLLFSIPAASETLHKLEVSASRTHEAALRSLIETREGDEFSAEVWRRDVERIEDTHLFYKVSASTVTRDGRLHARVRAENKFSTIPILKFKRGGGSSVYTAGLYEVNLGRSMLETGAQYESFNGKPGMALWVRHPYFPTRRDRAGADLIAHTVNLPLLNLDGEPEADFENEETRLNLHYSRELARPWKAGLTASVFRNVFRADDSTAEKAARNAAYGTSRLNGGRTVTLSPKLSYGRLLRGNVQLRGFEASVGGEWAWRGLGSEFDYIKGVLRLQGGAVPVKRLNLAGQLMIGAKTGNEFQHKFYLGGLDSVRGFLDGQFRGNHAWVINMEARPTLVESDRWVLQGNVFTDWAKTWDESAFDLDGFDSPFLSHGVGFRLILPRVYRAVLRADLAWTREPFQRMGFSMGLQQFF